MSIFAWIVIFVVAEALQIRYPSIDFYAWFGWCFSQ